MKSLKHSYTFSCPVKKRKSCHLLKKIKSKLDIFIHRERLSIFSSLKRNQSAIFSPIKLRNGLSLFCPFRKVQLFISRFRFYRALTTVLEKHVWDENFPRNLRNVLPLVVPIKCVNSDLFCGLII